MVKNLAKEILFYCLNPIHPEPVLMVFRERSDDGRDDFYACPKYMLEDEKHPDGHRADEPACMNRLGLSDAGEILSQFNKTVEEDLDDNCFADYTNYTFKYRSGITVKVLKYESGKSLWFGILNRRAMNSSGRKDAYEK